MITKIDNLYIIYDFFLYTKMINKYYQNHKEKLRKEARERYQYLSEEIKEKCVSIIVNVIRIFLKKKKKRNLSVTKVII